MRLRAIGQASGLFILMGAALTGCMSTPREAQGTLLGGGVGALAGGLIGGAAGGSSGAAIGLVSGAVVGGIAGNAIGRDMDDRDRQLAYEAEMAAFESGQRRPWRGARGAYGYVEPGPEFVEARGTCRNFNHRIFVAGRPATSTGVACLRPDGVWQIVG